ncbi:upstream stimulatory factor 2-like isoform X2 [Calonectris borealis]|uniref:upstream stimulatory factor 2-like isoform X2 n=1 Tax=Calonectris borealis TaxID=1323832 RepID=UPI003F4BF21A
MDMLDPGLDTAAGSAAPSHEKSQEAEEGVDLQEGEGAPGEEAAVAIASVPVPVPGAFADSGLQYQFRTESNGGQAVIQRPLQYGGEPPGPRAGPKLDSPGGGEGTVSVQADPALAQAGGQFYVMMTPQDVLQTGTQRSIAPHAHPYSP